MEEADDYADPALPRPSALQVAGCIMLVVFALAISLVLAFLTLQGVAPA